MTRSGCDVGGGGVEIARWSRHNSCTGHYLNRDGAGPCTAAIRDERPARAQRSKTHSPASCLVRSRKWAAGPGAGTGDRRGWGDMLRASPLQR
ncbi:hypothetical protein NDU88_002888 [Pleurodeles waltl]|uniref:Uncharacterized protein n=1 Tax=Pleurodeles waltl TaxID=8319 RepID=A0AAV7PB09_PLEWA|nr:hypothetical protein NDU88_002888 [Pleurodeles waltl]